MYTVLLVDDEPWILSGLQDAYEWQEFGFEVIAATTKPTEAWQIIQNQKPDVVITDIRMPNITGLELISRTREAKIDCEFVIISGYDEFEYAREALRNSVLDYLLKPIDETVAEKTWRKLKTHLDKKPPKIGFEDEKIKIFNNEFNNLVDYINNNYHQKLYLNELADMFYINHNYCCYLFKKHFDKSYSEYVISVRMKEAGKLIYDKSLKISEIAKLVGYDDYFYFNKVFKKYYKLSPMQFRKKL